MNKVIYISYDGISEPVGQSQVLPYLNGLSEKGIKITLISFEKENNRRKNICLNISWLPLSYHKYPVIPATLFDILNGFFRSSALIRKNKTEIIHARGYIPGLIAYLAARLHKVEYLFDMRGFWPEEKIDAGAWKDNGLLYRIIKFLEKRIILNAGHIIVLTEAARDLVRKKFCREGVSVIPCCVDLEDQSFDLADRPDIGLPKGRKIVTYSGSIGTFYDFKGMIDFFKVFKGLVPSAFFLILTSADHQGVREILRQNDVSENDYLLRSVSCKETPLYLKQSDFTLAFYNRRLSNRGCSPIKFSESLACGVPVIVSPGIGDCEMIINREKVGIVARKEDYRLAAKQMIELLKERDGVAKRCLNTAERYFSLKEGINRYLRAYQDMGKSDDSKI